MRGKKRRIATTNTLNPMKFEPTTSRYKSPLLAFLFLFLFLACNDYRKRCDQVELTEMLM